MPEVPTPDNRDHQVSRAKGVGLRGGAPVETMVVVLLAVFALGLVVGYGVRAQVSRKRHRRHARRFG